MREFDETPKEEERSVGQENVGSAVFQQPVQSSDIPPSDNTASDRSGGEPFADGAAPAGTAASSPDNAVKEPTGRDVFSDEKPETDVYKRQVLPASIRTTAGCRLSAMGTVCRQDLARLHL